MNYVLTVKRANILIKRNILKPAHAKLMAFTVNVNESWRSVARVSTHQFSSLMCEQALEIPPKYKTPNYVMLRAHCVVSDFVHMLTKTDINLVSGQKLKT